MSGQCEGQPSAWIQGLHQSWPIRVSKKPFPPQKKPKSSDHANSYSQMLARVGHSHAQGCQVWRRYPFLDMVQFSRQQRNVPELCFRGADWWIWRRQVPSTFRGQPRKRQQPRHDRELRRPLPATWRVRHHHERYGWHQLPQGHHWRRTGRRRGRALKLCSTDSNFGPCLLRSFSNHSRFSSLIFCGLISESEGARDSDHFRHSDQHTAAICRRAYRLFFWLFQLPEQQHIIWHILPRGWRSHLHRI
jgi:hypothetical protein